MIQDLLRNFDEDPDALWGDPRRHGDLWAAHNPYDLASQLREVGLFVSVGSGQPGPLDGLATNGQLQQIEQAPYPQNLAFVERPRSARHPRPVRQLRPRHPQLALPQRELHRSLPMLLGAHSAQPQHQPARHRSTAPHHTPAPRLIAPSGCWQRPPALVIALTALVLAIAALAYVVSFEAIRAFAIENAR